MRYSENTPIQDFLTSRGLTEAELAKRAWCCQRTVQRWTREGKQPRSRILSSLARVLNTTPLELAQLARQQRLLATVGQFNFALLKASQECEAVARLTDAELKSAGIDVSRLNELLRTVHPLRDRLANLVQNQAKERRVMRPPPRPSTVA